MPFNKKNNSEPPSIPVVIGLIVIAYSIIGVLPLTVPLKIGLLALAWFASLLWIFRNLKQRPLKRGDGAIKLPESAGVCPNAYNKRHVTSDAACHSKCILCAAPLVS
jgi:hypothetical protein